jgi:ribonuclease HI
MRYDAHALETNARVVKWPGQSLFWKHVPRAMNSFADRLANMSLDSGTVIACRIVPIQLHKKFAVFTDGACTGNPGRCGA